VSALPGDASIRWLWSTPRSVSTAFAKAVGQLPGVRLVHEPYTGAYYFGPERRSRRYGDSPEQAGDTGTALAAELTRLARTRPEEPVFVKELAFQGAPYLTPALAASGRHSFLVRHPVAVYESLVRLKPDFTAEEFGFEPMGRIFDRLTGAGGAPPLVVDGDDFRSAPEPVFRHYCQALGLPFTTAALTWADGRIRPWRPSEERSQARWHHTLEESHGIIQVARPQYSVPDGLDPDRRAALFDALEIYHRIAPARTAAV
jgi:hypothetical protein